MPVEINELVVRVVVDSTADRTAPPAAGSASSNQAREALVQQCVDAVLEALRNMKER